MLLVLLKKKYTESPEKLTFPCISTKSSHTTALPTTSAKRNQPGIAQDATFTHSVQSSVKYLHAVGGKQQKFDETTEKGWKVWLGTLPEEFSFVDANEVLASNKSMTESKTF